MQDKKWYQTKIQKILEANNIRNLNFKFKKLKCEHDGVITTCDYYFNIYDSYMGNDDEYNFKFNLMPELNAESKTKEVMRCINLIEHDSVGHFKVAAHSIIKSLNQNFEDIENKINLLNDFRRIKYPKRHFEDRVINKYFFYGKGLIMLKDIYNKIKTMDFNNPPQYVDIEFWGDHDCKKCFHDEECYCED